MKRVSGRSLPNPREIGFSNFRFFEVAETEWLDEGPVRCDSLVTAAPQKRIPLLKTGEVRYVFGIVLEPETLDAQKDIY